MPTIRVADFFCGIGGNSVAAEALCLEGVAFEFAHGFDVSDSCLRVYKANFKKAVPHVSINWGQYYSIGEYHNRNIIVGWSHMIYTILILLLYILTCHIESYYSSHMIYTYYYSYMVYTMFSIVAWST
eukprot:Protomagalhaensia_wolfi_Nauph_80__2172@NODE_23_length_4810_cov_19_376441_g18_i0_p5_GENE_NODE_23_length_4810_cov_19_376441_g18_i0NODE_23_length_4810_cov_19_376441_g18_i0_p5_ORF_typecomplete_len128_score4_00DNA_methylase/PF00145_17/3_1e06Methyltransf_15/PF09445_10/0_012UPF0020/PF01170_18/0_055Methyltransf_31/PF13847_6/0_18_NODE_23_length_4810_cov_19_376441_g18_i091474